jgi:hypothetical protein
MSGSGTAADNGGSILLCLHDSDNVATMFALLAEELEVVDGKSRAKFLP